MLRIVEVVSQFPDTDPGCDDANNSYRNLLWDHPIILGEQPALV
jgi:hypothetical protein